MSKQIKIELPRGFMNVDITLDNHLIADTNNSSNWDKIKFPLPTGKWSIDHYENNNKIVVLNQNKDE
jgi:hypothetical protein